MAVLFLPLLVLLGGPGAPPAQVPARPVVAAPAQTPRPVPKPYNETADAKAAIAAMVKKAAIDDIRVLINWGANDNARCEAFAKALATPEVRATKYSADEYFVVNVDVGKLDKNLDLAKQYGVTLTANALPVLTVLDDKGKVLASAPSTTFENAGDPPAFDSAKIAKFFTTHQAPYPDAVAPFEAAKRQAKRDGKLVFVWFSAPW